MLKRLLSKLLGLDKHRGSHYRPYRSSSDDYRKYGSRPHSSHRHNQYGHNHYKRRGSSSSYSS
ncbi:hypothetical protein [Paenibacillus rigui]|nr:hypothetical protein [Paenibacillus rigui]